PWVRSASHESDEAHADLLVLGPWCVHGCTRPRTAAARVRRSGTGGRGPGRGAPVAAAGGPGAARRRHAAGAAGGVPRDRGGRGAVDQLVEEPRGVRRLVHGRPDPPAALAAVPLALGVADPGTRA